MKDSLTLRKRLGLEINRKLTDNLIAAHPLRQLFWECTLRCNLHCRHCGSDCKKIAGYQDMPKEDFLRVLDNIAAHTDPHKVFVILTGGEPLVREDLEDCGRAIYEKGFPWGMVTNGLYLTPERLERLLQAGMHTATVSLDGFKEEHNWMRGHPQSFDRATAAIRMLAALPGFVFDVVTCVNKHNYAYLEELKQYLIGIGLKRWRLFTVFPVGRAAHDAELQLSPEEFRGMLEFIKRTRQAKEIHIPYQLRMRRILGQLRRRCARPFVQLPGRHHRRLGTDRRVYFFMPQHPCRLSSGQHLPRRLYGRMGKPFPPLPRP